MYKILSQLINKKFPLFCFIYLAFFLITSSNYFFWDAAVLEVGILENNLSGWRDLNSLAGLDLNFWYYFTIFQISQFLPGSHGILFSLISLLWILGLTNELSKISKKYFSFGEMEVYFLQSLIFILPIWNLLSSQVIHFYAFTYFLLFAGFNLLESKNLILKSLALFLLSISFLNASNHLIVIGLAALPISLNFSLRTLLNFVFISLFSLILFIAFGEFFNATDVYSEYNRISFLSFSSYFAGIFSFGFWALLSIAIFLISSAISRIIFNQALKNRIVNFKNFKPLFLISILLFCACVPYIVVNKYPPINNLYTWESRHALAFIIMLVPFIISLNKAMFGVKKNALIIFTLLIFITSFHHMTTKVVDRFYLSVLQKSLPAEKPEPGLVHLKTDLKFSNVLRHYGLGNLFYKKYDEIEWYILIADNLPDWANLEDLEDQYFGKKMISLVGQEMACYSEIALSSSNQYNYVDVLKWVFFNEVPALEILKFKKECQKKL